MFLDSCVVVKPGLKHPSSSFDPQVLEFQAPHRFLSVNYRLLFLEGALLWNTASLASLCALACVCAHKSISRHLFLESKGIELFVL